MSWNKSEYNVTDTITYRVPSEVIRECVDGAGWGGSKIEAIKKLRSMTRCEGPFGIPIVISLRDAKEIIEDYIDNR